MYFNLFCGKPFGGFEGLSELYGSVGGILFVKNIYIITQL